MYILSVIGELPLAERDRPRGEERARVRAGLAGAAAVAVAPGERHERNHQHELQGNERIEMKCFSRLKMMCRLSEPHI